MNAKEYLKRVRLIEIQIKNYRLELEALESKMRGNSSVGFEEKNNAQFNTKSPQEKGMNQYLKLKDKIDREINKLNRVRLETIQTINKLEDANCVNILYMRYIQFKGWEMIARESTYSKRNVMRIHAKALKQIENILKKEV